MPPTLKRIRQESFCLVSMFPGNNRGGFKNNRLVRVFELPHFKQPGHNLEGLNIQRLGQIFDQNPT